VIAEEFLDSPIDRDEKRRGFVIRGIVVAHLRELAAELPLDLLTEVFQIVRVAHPNRIIPAMRRWTEMAPIAGLVGMPWHAQLLK
jgi:hypothetical protein